MKEYRAARTENFVWIDKGDGVLRFRAWDGSRYFPHSFTSETQISLIPRLKRIFEAELKEAKAVLWAEEKRNNETP